MLLKSIWLGVTRNKRGIVASALKAWGVVWLITNSTSFFSPDFRNFAEAHATPIWAASVLGAIAYAVYAAKEVLKISFQIKTTNTKITIKFGDLFDSKGHIVIPVNEFFDSDLGQAVAANSVHGQFISRVLAGDASRFDTDVERHLALTPFENVDRTIGRPRRYPIGTTAVLNEGPRKYFLLALTKTHPETCVASADVPQLWSALICLWDNVRAGSNGECVHLPLVGAGLARLNLDPSHLLRLSLLTVLIETRRAPIANEIEIVLHQSLLGRIDLRAVAADWR